MTKPVSTPPPAPKAPKPTGDPRREGVRRQRQHIKDFTGQDPLRGGGAD